MKIVDYESYFILSGSLHKFWNNGEHNYNDLSFTNHVSTIKSIEKGFDLKLDETKIVNLEFGLNITTPILSTEIFLRGLMLHKGKHTLNDYKNHFEFKNKSIK